MIPQTRPVHLPPPDAPIETRVVAYRSLAAMPHRNFNGWRMRAGDGAEVGDVNDARAVMQNSPESARVFEDYDSTRRTGFWLMGGGIVATLGAPTILLATTNFRRSGGDPDTLSLAALSLTTLVGAVVMVVGAFIVGGTEHYVPEAAEAYNRWLWRRLALPERITLEGALHPSPSPDSGLSTQAPW